MLLYLLRHGIAEDHGSRDRDDERELTAEGKEKTKRIMQAVRAMKFLPPALVISSPLIRAVQTADIACKEFAREAQRMTSDALIPSADIVSTMSLLADHIKDQTPVMVVGHEPHLSTFASALLGSDHSIIEMKKAALAKFELYRLEVPRMRGFLTALITPSISNLI
ncbi:MAG TPA: phosphohistidine phosphatase SixA [Candidatus Kapabacteria bacterium]|nr:phosphohistidine phosphatase SixA [Candidatus Kapabacteria bacterium]